MKKQIILFTTLLIAGITTTFGQAVGIGTQAPNNSAILELNVDNYATNAKKGFLPPRMTTAQRTAIGSAAEGLTIYNTDTNCIEFYNGNDWVSTCEATSPWPANYVHCNGTPTEIVEVTSATGKIWMDRNLGASRAATAYNDSQAYGDLYQWGRGADGHQCRNSSGTTSTLSTTDTPEHGNFIIPATAPYDWRSEQNDNLWQGMSGTNNPCPNGFRLPTNTELEAERQIWSSNNRAGAFASVLKLPSAGLRHRTNAVLESQGDRGYYWSSTVSGTSVPRLYFYSSNADQATATRAYGFTVRCIKN